jgi:hypothetical protein
VIGRFCEHKEDIQCGEVFSHTPDHTMNNNSLTGVGPIKNCVCKEVSIRHPSLTLPFRNESGPKTCEYQEYGEKPFKWKDSGKAIPTSDSLSVMKEVTLERYSLYVSSVGKPPFV